MASYIFHLSIYEEPYITYSLLHGEYRLRCDNHRVIIPVREVQALVVTHTFLMDNSPASRLQTNDHIQSVNISMDHPLLQLIQARNHCVLKLFDHLQKSISLNSSKIAGTMWCQTQ